MFSAEGFENIESCKATNRNFVRVKNSIKTEWIESNQLSERRLLFSLSLPQVVFVLFHTHSHKHCLLLLPSAAGRHCEQQKLSPGHGKLLAAFYPASYQ